MQNLHNALGQRVVKTVNGDVNTAIHFLYDQSGQVIAEIDASTGTTLREYIYVNGQQIAIVDDTGTSEEETYFVHNDHLGTPQKITDQAQAIVWDATYKPFGEVEVATAEIENNVRFPGQYADDETGLHYNYFRDYDPSTGRYVESDPIGLKGGLHTYVYTSNAPTNATDPTGTVIWKGTYYGWSAGYRTAGATRYWFTLRSECINNEMYQIRVEATGSGADYGLKAGNAAGNISFDDNMGKLFIYPKAFEGRFSMVTAGITVGLGGGVSSMRLGSARSIGTLGVEFGLSAGVSWHRNGVSKLLWARPLDCCS